MKLPLPDLDRTDLVLRQVSRRRLLLTAGLSLFRSRLPAAGQGNQLIRLSGSSPVFETKLESLGRHLITANEDFFVLSRQPIAFGEAEKANWQIAVTGEVERPLRLTMDEIRSSPAFPRAQIEAFVQCAGYGRRFFEPAISGLRWGRGAIGNAVWEGIRLADVLSRAGLQTSARHFAFYGRDWDLVSPPYIKSVPLEKAMDQHTLLAYRMNGRELPTAHGGPVRVLVPGWAGTYSVKWLLRIEALASPWDGFWMNQAYRLPLSPIEPGSQPGSFPSVPMAAVRVNSMITKPLEGDRIPVGATIIEGLAWSGEAPVERVAVSTDGGRNWRLARLDLPNHRFAWRRWHVIWNPSRGSYDIVARAQDTSGAIQPLHQENWNPGGYAWQVAPSMRVMVV